MSLYIDKNTNLIHEVKLFEDFALVRPLDPNRRRDLQKLDYPTFDKYFEEYSGDQSEIYKYLAGEDSSVLVGGTETMQ